MRFFYILLLFTTQSFATAELYLSGGESTSILANTTTSVYCDSTANIKCEIPLKNFEILLNGCSGTYQEYACFKKYISNFKENYPNCSYMTIELCMRSCTKVYSGSTCADSCQKFTQL